MKGLKLSGINQKRNRRPLPPVSFSLPEQFRILVPAAAPGNPPLGGHFPAERGRRYLGWWASIIVCCGGDRSIGCWRRSKNWAFIPLRCPTTGSGRDWKFTRALKERLRLHKKYGLEWKESCKNPKKKQKGRIFTRRIACVCLQLAGEVIQYYTVYVCH